MRIVRNLPSLCNHSRMVLLPLRAEGEKKHLLYFCNFRWVLFHTPHRYAELPYLMGAVPSGIISAGLYIQKNGEMHMASSRG